MEKKSNYTLPDIAGWAEQGLVSLPSVQRGFVWRPSQIENLWDSLLRGYPIGAFVMSPKESNGSFEMLDGQQRATSICLGFGKETFRDSQDKIKVFIDLDKQKGDDNRKYIFRVITRSHPWGYQKTDNTKTLISDNIRKAMNLYGEEDHLEADLNKFFPYDASLPIPFNLFIEAAVNNENIEQLLIKIYHWSHWDKVLKHWNDKVEKFRSEIQEKLDSKKKLPVLSTQEGISKRINEIFSAVKNMLDSESGREIPALYLDIEQFKNEFDDIRQDEIDLDEKKENIEEDNNDFDSDKTEIEELFIRLNSGGTQLRGEELNYSILKAKITPDLQKLIEDACIGLFKPSRFITIAFRLFKHKKKQDDSLSIRIKPKQFQKTVTEDLDEFSNFLNSIFAKNVYNGSSLLQYVKALLVFNEADNDYGLPYLITSKIADVAPEVMFVLLFRILIKKDEFDFNTELHRKMIGMITLFMWFGKGEKQRDHGKLISNIWQAVEKLDKELFWSSSTVQRAMLNEVLLPFPSFDAKHDRRSLIKIKQYDFRSNTDLKEKFNRDTNYGGFLQQIFNNSDLVLYAQRHFLSTIFNEKQYHLDDTNVPFDWDHISPRKFISKHGIPKILKEWYNSNGNYRAWPYSMNRMDQDSTPALKLDPLNSDQNHKLGSEEYEEVEGRWKSFLEKESIQTPLQLKQSLLEKSFCYKEWADCKATDMKKKSEWEEVSKLIINRNLSICKVWYDELRINDLIPSNKESLSTIFNIKKWDKNKLRKDFEIEGIHWVSKPITIGKSKVSFLFNHSEANNEVLEEGDIRFGLYESESGNFIKTIKIPDKFKDDIVTDKDEYILGQFTLISHDDVSYIKLLNDFYCWLKKYTNRDFKILSESFINMLSIKYKNKIKKINH